MNEQVLTLLGLGFSPDFMTHTKLCRGCRSKLAVTLTFPRSLSRPRPRNLRAQSGRRKHRPLSRRPCAVHPVVSRYLRQPGRGYPTKSSAQTRVTVSGPRAHGDQLILPRRLSVTIEGPRAGEGVPGLSHTAVTQGLESDQQLPAWPPGAGDLPASCR